jgi:hypothetical protein
MAHTTNGDKVFFRIANLEKNEEREVIIQIICFNQKVISLTVTLYFCVGYDFVR